MKNNSSDKSLSEAMKEVFKLSETNRIKRFYSDRFHSNGDNLVAAFLTVSEGIDAMGLTNIIATDNLLKMAAHADRLPSRAEAEVISRAYAAFLANPHR